jgi:hypothetical protein
VESLWEPVESFTGKKRAPDDPMLSDSFTRISNRRAAGLPGEI